MSFNSEGFVSTQELKRTLEELSQVDQQMLTYNTYRASRNLRGCPAYIQEYLFLLDKAG